MGSAGRRDSAPSDLPSEFASSITQFGSPAGHEPTAALRASVRRHRSHLGRRLRRPLIWQSDADWPGPRLSCGRPRSFSPKSDRARKRPDRIPTFSVRLLLSTRERLHRWFSPPSGPADVQAPG